MALIDVKVPDIGDFKDVAVIELLVKPGDSVQAEQSLITVESDKASMEIPCSQAGVLKELKVKLGDKVNEGDVIAVLEADAAVAALACARECHSGHSGHSAYESRRQMDEQNCATYCGRAPNGLDAQP